MPGSACSVFVILATYPPPPPIPLPFVRNAKHSGRVSVPHVHPARRVAGHVPDLCQHIRRKSGRSRSQLPRVARKCFWPPNDLREKIRLKRAIILVYLRVGHACLGSRSLGGRGGQSHPSSPTGCCWRAKVGGATGEHRTCLFGGDYCNCLITATALSDLLNATGTCSMVVCQVSLRCGLLSLLGQSDSIPSPATSRVCCRRAM